MRTLLYRFAALIAAAIVFLPNLSAPLAYAADTVPPVGFIKSLADIKDVSSFLVIIAAGVWFATKGGPAILAYLKSQEDTMKQIASSLATHQVEEVKAIDAVRTAMLENVSASKMERAEFERLVIERTEDVAKEVHTDGDKTRLQLDKVISLAGTMVVKK